MSALQSIATVLHRARVAGGWDDEEVAAQILRALNLDDEGKPRELVHTSSEIGHG